MKALNLVLHGVYYDLIKQGKKKHEYRTITDYYVSRLIGGIGGMDKQQLLEFTEKLKKPSERDEAMKKAGAYIRTDYTHCHFRRGSSDTWMYVKIEGIKMYANNFDIELGDVSEG